MDEPFRESGPHLARVLASVLDGDGPLYRLLANGLKQAIDRGDIPLGTVLPPERQLAKALNVSRATVVAAYDRLKAEGWLESRQGSGTWVRSPEPSTTRVGVDAVSTARLFLSDDGHEQRSGPGEDTPFDRDVIDLSVAAVLSTPLVDQLLSSLEPAAIAELSRHHGYLPQGLRALRDAVAHRFEVQGLPTTPDHVLITTGAHQAISLVVRQALQPGNTVLVESPTFPGALDIFRRYGGRVVALPVDAHGVRTDELDQLAARVEPTLLYVSPHFHNPTGAVLPIERRREIGRVAAAAGIVVIEDLAMGDVVLDDVDLPPPIAALVPEASVHTIGSTAKLFWAGLRVGWIRSPTDWAVRMLATKTVADLGTPLISQLLAERLLASFDAVQAERRAQLRPRRDLLRRLLTEHLPEWEHTSPPGGLALWIMLPRGNADELAEVALRHGVAIVPGPALSVDDGNRRGLRIAFTQPEQELEEGVLRLTRAWHAYEPTTSRSAARLLV